MRLLCSGFCFVLCLFLCVCVCVFWRGEATVEAKVLSQFALNNYLLSIITQGVDWTSRRWQVKDSHSSLAIVRETCLKKCVLLTSFFSRESPISVTWFRLVLRSMVKGLVLQTDNVWFASDISCLLGCSVTWFQGVTDALSAVQAQGKTIFWYHFCLKPRIEPEAYGIPQNRVIETVLAQQKTSLRLK